MRRLLAIICAIGLIVCGELIRSKPHHYWPGTGLVLIGVCFLIIALLGTDDK